MIHDKKEFGLGLILLTGFFLVLAVLFMPLWPDGKNTISYLDNVFNSISKNSAYYIPDLNEKAEKHAGSAVSLTLQAASAPQAERMEKLLGQGGAGVTRQEMQLAVDADLGKLLGQALTDADLMFANDGAAVTAKYGLEARQALFDWHKILSAAAKDLDRQGRFAESKILHDVVTKGVEPAYNYYGIEAIPIMDLFWIVLAALVGYVIYTVWYGYAILFLFEGIGLRLEH
ncbi:MAG: hypothetical protein KGZ43_07860 [Sulfuritalea sp.]|nr:hypothetical protein [Sulfuritalea sp.]